MPTTCRCTCVARQHTVSASKAQTVETRPSRMPLPLTPERAARTRVNYPKGAPPDPQLTGGPARLPAASVATLLVLVEITSAPVRSKSASPTRPSFEDFFSWLLCPQSIGPDPIPAKARPPCRSEHIRGLPAPPTPNASGQSGLQHHPPVGAELLPQVLQVEPVAAHDLAVAALEGRWQPYPEAATRRDAHARMAEVHVGWAPARRAVDTTASRNACAGDVLLLGHDSRDWAN